MSKEGEAPVEPTTPPGTDPNPTPGASVSESMWGELAVEPAESPSTVEATPAATPEQTPTPSTGGASPQTPAAPSPGTSPTTPQAAVPPATGTPPQGTTPEPEATPAVSSPTPTPSATPAVDQAALYKTGREAYIKELSTNRYRIADDVAAQLAAEPEKHLPALLAQAHMNAYEDAMREVLRILPVVVPQLLQTHTTAQTAETSFFSKFPGLAPHRKEVTETAALIRSRNPGITMEQLITQVGTIVSTIKGVPLPGVTPPPTPPASRAPFSPASPGGPAGTSPPKETNPFAALADEIRQEDF